MYNDIGALMSNHIPTIDSTVVKLYGDIKLSYLLITGFEVLPTPPRLKKVARKVEQDLRDQFSTPDDSDLLQSWRRLAHDMGLTDADDLPAPRALVENVLLGRNIPKINCVVDAANITAIKYQTPVGVFDADMLEPPIRLRLAQQDEGLVPILATAEVKCKYNEIVYADSTRIFSRYSRDADYSKITEHTKNILCVVDGTSEISRTHIVNALSFLESLFADVGTAGWTCRARGDAVVVNP
jgi:DNA/RNA-binding domain of Phe-tRNA-synthetase-like protein